jgi:sterol desaturase/sphingolipid hydroxylase (fatty acid hydroxylase superfamily)
VTTIPLLSCALIGGAVSWSFAEYALHNWLGHLGRGRNDFSREHLAHHSQPTYFTSLTKKVTTGAMVLSILAVGAVALFGPIYGLVAVASFGASYTMYEVLHRRIHTHPPTGPYSRFVRKHHYAHHFCDPSQNHGVTSPMWDIVFGTYTPAGRIPVVARHAMDWLCDEAGVVHPELAADYEIVRRAGGRPSRPAPRTPEPVAGAA